MPPASLQTSYLLHLPCSDTPSRLRAANGPDRQLSLSLIPSLARAVHSPPCGGGAPTALGSLRHLTVPACRVTGTRAVSGAPPVASLVSGPLFRARADEHNLAPIQAAFTPPFSPSTSSP